MVMLSTMMPDSDRPVETSTTAVAASMPARRNNCHGRSPGSVEVAELIVELLLQPVVAGRAGGGRDRPPCARDQRRATTASASAARPATV